MNNQSWNIFHAILITEQHGSYLEPLLQSYYKSVVCVSKIKNRFCDVCENCKKINNNLYFDLIVLDGAKQTIKKENVIEIQNRFLHMGLERGNKKIYVIKQIERSNNQAINSLLKFLEEPPKDTYAILTTRQEISVPQTILSRCQRFLAVRSDFDWTLVGNKYGLTKNDVKVLTSMYWTIDDVLEALKNGSYLEISNLAKRFLEPKKSILEIKELSEKFKSLSFREIELILNYLLFCMDMNGKEIVLELLNDLSLNPIRSSLFWNIIKVAEEYGTKNNK